jgi:O-antigen ligase
LNPELRRKSKLLMLAAVPVVVALYFSFSIAARNNPQFNSVSARVDQISAAIHVWHLSPILGEGMRFYNLPQFILVTAPPNVFIDNLASTGIIGSLAFVFMVCVTVRTMFRLPYALGTLGLVILVFHYVDGLFDIFWIGASTIAPFIIAGISLGMADMDKVAREARAGPDLTTARSPDVIAGPVPDPPRGRVRPSVAGRVAGLWAAVPAGAMLSVRLSRVRARLMPAR